MTRLAPLVAALSAALAACGAPGGPSGGGEARLLLDARPNAIHAGLYLADARGFTDAEGVDLTLEVPEAETDPVALLSTRRVQFAVMDIHDVALAREGGADLVAVMALVQRPLAAVLAAEKVRSPRDLQRRRVGVPARPWAGAVLDAMVRAAGGRPTTLRRRPAGAGARALAPLLDGTVDAVVGFWPVEGVALEATRPRAKQFRVEEFGAPRHPELVLVATRATLQDAPALVQATVTALRRGYREVILGPEEAVSLFVDRVGGLDRRATQAQLDAVLPALSGGGRGFGTLDVASLERWASWEQRFGITRRVPDVPRMFAPRFARRGVIAG